MTATELSIAKFWCIQETVKTQKSPKIFCKGDERRERGVCQKPSGGYFEGNAKMGRIPAVVCGSEALLAAYLFLEKQN